MAANIFTGATNSLFSVATNWSLGTVPTSTDANTATFDATSPNCTVNVSSNCQSLDFTGYTNVLTMTFILTVSNGTVTFQANQSSRIAGTQSLILNGNCSIIANGATWNNGISNLTVSGIKTLTGTLTIAGLYSPNAAGTVFNGGTLVLNGGLNANQTQSGTTAIILGGGTWSSGAFQSNPITIAGNVTVSGTVGIQNTTITYSSGTVTTTGSTLVAIACTLNTSGVTWATVTCGSSNTNILTSDLNCDTFLTAAGNANVWNGAFNINCNNLTGGSAGVMSGTATIRMIGTGTWSMTTGVLANNLIFDSTGTITVSGAVTYQTGTITYTTGTVITTGSTLLIIASATLATNGIIWNNITLGTTLTLTLTTALNISGTFIPCTGGVTVTINTSTVNISGNLSVQGTGGIVTGTSLFNINGTGTWSHTSTTILRNSVNIDTVGTLTISGTVYYNTGTLTYIAGDVVTTGSTLSINVSTTLNLGTMPTALNNIITAGTSITITLLSDLYVDGNLTLQGNTSQIINGNTIFCNSNLIVNGTAQSGTTTIVLSGTGSWLNTLGGARVLSNNLTINTTGTITFDSTNALYYNTGTITYIAGNVDTSGSTLFLNFSATLNLGLMPTALNNLTTTGTSATITLLSDLYVRGTITLTSGGNPIWTGNTMYIGGNLIHQTNSVHSGTTAFVMNGTGTYSSASINCIIRNNFTINTTGKITFGAIVAYNTGTFTYLSGKVVVPKNAIMYIAASTTLINCHKINFETVQITAGTTTTMNEFFSGSPNKPVKVQSSSTANYNIAFQNGYQKVSKFVKISNMTLINTVANRGSLLILNSKGKYFRGSNNVGNIKYTNQSPNGIAKGEPTVPNQMTAPIGGYLSDPVFN